MSEQYYHTLNIEHSFATSQLIQKVIRQYNSDDYTEDGVNSLLEFTSEPFIRKLLSLGKTIGVGCSIAENDVEKLIGVCIIRDWSHMLLFFVDGAYHGQGIGRKLFELALDQCHQKSPDLNMMTVNSTIFALEAYKKLGFVPTDDPQHQNGIVYVPMEISLQSS